MARTDADTAQLDALAALPDPPIIKVCDAYYAKDPIEVYFDSDGYFAVHHIDPNALYKPGVTYGQ